MTFLRNILIACSLAASATGATFAAYYYPTQTYQYPYQANYVISNYVPAVLTNCYYTQSYPVTYYGNCYGSNYTNYTYPVPQVYPYYNQNQYTYGNQNYPYYQNYGQNYTYGNQYYTNQYQSSYYQNQNTCYYTLDSYGITRSTCQ